MRVSTKVRYATSAILDIALFGKEKAVSISIISRRQKISKDYLEQLFRKLKIAQIITSQKGVYGGYKLNRKPEDITLKNIFEAVGEPTKPVFCLTDITACQNAKSCLTRTFWQELEQSINKFLQEKTIAELMIR